jgi:hypothetical protein
LQVKHFRLSAVLRAWEAERKRLIYTVKHGHRPERGATPLSHRDPESATAPVLRI